MPKEFLKINNDKVITEQDIDLVDKAVESGLFYLSPDREELEWGDVGLFCQVTNNMHPERYCHFDFEASFFGKEVAKLINAYNIFKESSTKANSNSFLQKESFLNLVSETADKFERKIYKILGQKKYIRKALKEFDYLTEYTELILDEPNIQYEYKEEVN